MQVGDKVLFVDDDDVIVMLASKTLRRLGREVEAFTDAKSALAAFAAAPATYSIVVSDVRLGDGDAFAMCEELLRIRRDVRIVLVSGLARPEDHERALALGIGDVLSKSHVMTRLPELFGRARA